MANWLYNTVELPAVPADWNKETHPFLVVQNSRYLWMCDANTFYVNSSGGLWSSGTVNLKRYTLQNGVWVHTDDFTWGAIGITSASGINWVSDDLPNSDGSIYLAANKPIDVETGKEIDLFPAPEEPEEPVPSDSGYYFYNGVKLPAPPDGFTGHMLLLYDNETNRYFMCYGTFYRYPFESKPIVVHKESLPTCYGLYENAQQEERNTCNQEKDNTLQNFGNLNKAQYQSRKSTRNKEQRDFRNCFVSSNNVNNDQRNDNSNPNYCQHTNNSFVLWIHYIL